VDFVAINEKTTRKSLLMIGTAEGLSIGDED